MHHPALSLNQTDQTMILVHQVVGHRHPHLLAVHTEQAVYRCHRRLLHQRRKHSLTLEMASRRQHQD